MNSIKGKINWTIITDLLMTLLTYIAIYSNGKILTEQEIVKIMVGHGSLARELAKFTLSLPVATLESGFVFCVLLFLYSHYHYIFCTIKKAPFILSAFFSLCMILGTSYELYDGSILIWQNHFQVFLSLLSFIGWFTLFYLLGNLILYQVNNYIKNPNNETYYAPQWIYTWKLPLLILICWLPILILHYPSSFDHDSFSQLVQWEGKLPFNSHHPVISTVFFGVFMDLGNALGSANLGAFAIVVLQTTLLLISLTLLIKKLVTFHFPLPGIYFSIGFFALCPIWPGYMQCVIKDSMNLSLNIFYILLYLNLLTDDSWILKRQNQILFFISLISICCFRNTGIHLAVLTLVPYFILNVYRNKNNKCYKYVLGIFMIFLLFHIGYNNIFLEEMGVRKGPVKEMLSIPFQQTARYVKYYPKDIKDGEKKAISLIFDYDKLGDLYKPNISDPVKDSSHVKNKDLPVYFKAWFTMGLRHPGVYMDATLNNIYDYFYPDGFSKPRQTGMKLYIRRKADPAKNMKSPNDGTYDVMYKFPFKTRGWTDYYMTQLWRSIPVIGMCYNAGIYTWIVLICLMLLMFFAKYEAILGLIPSISIILFCLASPVNGYIRYMLPAIAVTPLIVAWTLYSIRKKHKGKGENSR